MPALSELLLETAVSMVAVLAVAVCFGVVLAPMLVTRDRPRRPR